MQLASGIRKAAVVVCAMGILPAWADQGAEQVRAQLDLLSQGSGGSFRVEEVKPAQTEQVYQVELSGGELVHAMPSADGAYLLVGSLMQVQDGQLVNLTEREREQALKAARVGMLEKLKQADAIVFAPEGETKATLNVFTDISCGFCRKLHQEIPALNAQGIAVRYLAFPRGGQRSATYGEMRSIWCSEDRQQQMTAAKRGHRVAPQQCDTDAIEQQYLLGVQMGVSGTPAIFLEDGRLIPGYRDAATLVKMAGVK